MKILLTAACLLLAAAARADLSDPGNLTIGGQGVIGGTMTVQGNAFGVGGSSFVVSGGSATLAYQLTLGSLNMSGSSATITTKSSVTASAFFGDGSHLTGVNSLSGGTNGYSMRWTGATSAGLGSFSDTGSSATVLNGNAFVLAAGSTMTIGPSSYSSTFTISGRIINAWNTVSITSFTGVSSIYFYGLASATTYRGTCNFIKHTAGQIYIQLSGDAGTSSYVCALNGATNNNAPAQQSTCSGLDHSILTGVWSTIADGGDATIVIKHLRTVPGSSSHTRILMDAGFEYTSGGAQEIDVGTINYLGSNTLSSMKIYPSAGTVDGQCYWEQFVTNL